MNKPTGAEERTFWGQAAIAVMKALATTKDWSPEVIATQAAADADALLAEYKKRNGSQP